MSGLLFAAVVAGAIVVEGEDDVPGFDRLIAQPVHLRPELEGVHPRVFVTAAGLDSLRERARTSHRALWEGVLQRLAAVQGPPPPPPGPQERRAQNVVAFAIAEIALAYAVEKKPVYLRAARDWLFAAIDYEPWGYVDSKPNVDLAAGHLLYAVGWAYDLLFAELTAEERRRVRSSLARHAQLVADHFTPGAKKRFAFSQNHGFIPTAGLAVAALALMGEVPEAERWAALARAHHHRAGQLLSPDGHYYEGFEYWIFSAPWLVHFLDAWEHATGESLWARAVFGNWKRYLAHGVLPNGQDVFDFGDVWQGAITRARQGADALRAYPDGVLESNYGVLHRVASRLRDPEAQAVADRLRGFGHRNQQEHWMLLWWDPALRASSMKGFPLTHHFADSGVVYHRTSWEREATAFAFKAGPPQGRRIERLVPRMPEARLDSGHAHPDAGSFIIWAGGRYLVGDTGYAGLPASRDHNTVTVNGLGQGREGRHDVWRDLPLGRILIEDVRPSRAGLRIRADLAGAYPPEAGVKALTRTFTFRAPGRFVVEDEVLTERPSPVVWYLHADRPLSVSAARFTIAGAMEGHVRLPARVRLTPRTTQVLAPGPPGAITGGQLEDRGFHLVVEPEVPATRTRIRVDLAIR